MLIGDDGEKLGMMPVEEALSSAQKKSLDLVQVSPSDANPVVCKLLDFGKFQFGKCQVGHWQPSISKLANFEF